MTLDNDQNPETRLNVTPEGTQLPTNPAVRPEALEKIVLGTSSLILTGEIFVHTYFPVLERVMASTALSHDACQVASGFVCAGLGLLGTAGIHHIMERQKS